MKWITSTDLKQWTPERDCQEHLPLLVRKLIRATSTKISKIIFPAGDNILLGGWDGILETTEETEYIPEGISLWEFGTDKGIKGKAEREFNKRTENSLNYDKTSSTFVFVTHRIWGNKEEWIQEKKQLNIWKDIVVYDAEYLEEWIEIAPAVGAWFAKHLGKYPKDVQPADDFWFEWSYSPKFQITPSLVTTGREEQLKSISSFLSDSPSILSVQAASRDEALAFITGSAKLSEPELQDDFFSRSLIINNAETFRIVSANRDSLILIPRFEDEGVINRAIAQGHHVIIPLGADNKATSENKIVLPKLDRDGFKKALQEIGFSEEDAKKHSKESSRSLVILRRQLEFTRNLPEWAKGEYYRDIIPGLIVGQWTESREGDKDIVSTIANQSYEQYIAKLTRWENSQDSPVYHIGSSWHLASPLDAWAHLASNITAHDFSNLEKSVLDTFGEINPSLELEPDKRLMSAFYGKESKYSGSLKKGLASSLVLIAVYGEKFKIQTPLPPQSWVDGIIYQILHKAEAQNWQTLDYHLPLLAEASPSSFLNMVEEALNKTDSPMMAMFEEASNIIAPKSYHTEILWSLEALAWSPHLLSRVALNLAKLASLDPGGTISNRPDDSLKRIFLPWLPQTNANSQQRQDALVLLFKRIPDITWDLLISLLPDNYRTTHPTNKTRWRRFSESTQDQVTYEELFGNYSFIVDLLLTMVNKEEIKLARLIENVAELQYDDRDKILSYIENNLSSINQKEYSIWHQLRKLLHKHRSHSETSWALPKSDLDRIEILYNNLAPQDTIDQYLWMFNDNWLVFAEGHNHNKFGYEAKLNNSLQKRIEGLKNIYNKCGINKLLELAKTVKEHWIFGETAAYILNDEEETIQILAILEFEDDKENRFVQGFIFRKSILNRFDWVKLFYQKLSERNYPHNSLAAFLLPIHQTQVLWDFLELIDDEVEKIYWQKCELRFYLETLDQNIGVIHKLQAVNRHISTLKFASHILDELPSGLIIDILEKTATSKSDDFTKLESHDIERLFEQLDKKEDVDKSKLPQLEWLYLPILSSYYSIREPKYLYKELTNSPDFFAEIIKHIYLSKDDKATEEKLANTDKDLIIHNLTQGYKLLDGWKTIPGVDEANNIDVKFLRNWIKEARALCKENGRLKHANYRIGKILAHYPEGAEIWPPEPICEIIDTINSRNLNDGFSETTHNKRSFSSRGPFDGGTREKNLAAYFKELAIKVAVKYPITSSILENISKGYERDAIKEDNSAALDDLEY